MLADINDAVRPVPITDRGIVARPEGPRVPHTRPSAVSSSPPTGITLRVDKAAHKDKLRLSDANLKEMLRIVRQQNEEKKQATANRMTPAQRRQLAMRRPGERVELEERPRSLGSMYASSNPSSTGF
ncbi:hypothetical protein AAVH_15834 [Aphelenchoides avenae]|nr:hypothetical protein AAVH_15834 [Aphelenchus avenae]